MESRPSLQLVVLVLLFPLSVLVQAQSSDGNSSNAAFVGACTRTCGAFETCFAYEGAEFCAPFCAPGRCNDTAEACILAGHACDRAPCLPVAVCEPKMAQPLQQSVAATNGSIDNDESAPQCARQCPMVDAPVCGSNGVSYANACFLEQAQCATPSLTLAYAQLCATDVAFNLQYNNATAANTSTMFPVAKPECDAIVCSTASDPVCTSNGTMPNFCFFSKAQCLDSRVTLLKRTSCEDTNGLIATCPTNCTQAFVLPICGSNGIIYGNECLFRQAKCDRKAYGELKAKDLSECDRQVGDSQGEAIDVAAWFALGVTRSS
jgi:hypothetical protein